MELFCTYTDKNYLPQLIALIESLNKYSLIDFKLYVLCLDEIVLQVLQKLDYDEVIVIDHKEYLNENPNQKIALSNRSLINYYYTCTPVLIKSIFNLNKNAARVTYLDADMYCLNDFGEYFKEIKNKDVSIVEHWKNSTNKLPHGTYNVSILTFSNTQNSLSCLNWWEKMTFQSTDFNEKVWGDQKYLDEFPLRFNNVHIIKHNGVGCAPWNINSYQVRLKNNSILVNDEKLIIYHFARVLMVNRFLFIPARRSNINKFALNLIYKVYFVSLQRSMISIKKILPNYSVEFTRHNLRGLILSILGGRTFLVYNDKIMRIGINIKLFYEES